MARELAYDEHGNLLIDVRGPRFGAAITMTVVAVALVIQGGIGQVLVAWQWLAFAVAAFGGLERSLYGNLFRFVKRRFDLGPSPATEPEAPPRFSQLVGFLMASAALVSFAAGADIVGWVFTGLILAASSLLALTGFCVGCEMYLLGKRLTARGAAS
ncbi:MAG TPA: DUF4395 domain-containing protein [Nitriliruptorales bacterium]